MYNKVDTSMDFVSREKEILEFWKAHDIFTKANDKNKGNEPFTFYDGPPTANGKPHIGHILTRCIKDLFPRYKSMQGFDVLRKAGWDTHGLPVELEVEKQLGLDGKEQIEEFGVEKFIQECKKSVWKYKAEWELMSDRVGYWADMQDPYVTYYDDYIESVWWSLKQISDKGLLYKGHKVVPYCPRCGTALSSHEVAQGYQDVKDLTAFVQFKSVDMPDTYFVAWTTTPWTLPSNVGLCVNANEQYAFAKVDGQTLIIAEQLLAQVLKDTQYTVEKVVGGNDLIGFHYEPLFDFQKDFVKEDAWFIVADNYVTLTDGTGIVHLAPAFGEDDARVGRENDLPFLQMVDAKGRFIEGMDWSGMDVQESNVEIVKALKIAGKILKSEKYEHSYPFCWRCDTKLIYYARSTWFIAMTKVKDILVANNQKINWMPENIKDGRMGNFLDNVVDWGLSRERYWGTPLPVWECECGHHHVIGSRSELNEMGGNVAGDLELHKPFVDKVELDCPKCGKKMKRVSEVIDCWYDSGSMPFAQWHYPFENKDKFADRFPADFISEAIDQTRGWFYTLQAIGAAVFEKAPYENCIVLGHVLDKDGKKMSKHVGNVVDPFEILDKQGADAVRWYFYTGSLPWLPTRFYDEAVSESQRKFMGTLWNTYAFFVMYAEIDQFDPSKYTLDKEKLSAMDSWILSRLNSLNEQTIQNLDDYKIYETGKELQRFVDDLSNWYVRRSRERFWAKGMQQDKINAYMTLYTVLVSVSKLIAPMTPFIAEQIYRNLVCSIDSSAPISIHLTDFPKADISFIDSEMEDNMDTVLEIVFLGRAARNNANIKNRQPLPMMMISGAEGLPTMYQDIICEELNLKELSFTDDASEYVDYKLKPQLKTLGPKYGKILPKIKAYLEQADGKASVRALKAGEKLEFDIEGTLVELIEEDVLVEPTYADGYAVEQEGGIAIVLETTLTDELIAEGIVRELISKVQIMRKEAGFEVIDRINVCYQADEFIQQIIEKYSDDIAETLLAKSITVGNSGSYDEKLDINGREVHVYVEKV